MSDGVHFHGEESISRSGSLVQTGRMARLVFGLETLAARFWEARETAAAAVDLSECRCVTFTTTAPAAYGPCSPSALTLSLLLRVSLAAYETKETTHGDTCYHMAY